MSGKRRYGPEIQWDQAAIDAALIEHGIDCFANLYRQRPHFVYRAYDAHDVLLYVGCTFQPWTRFDDHRRSSHWYSQAVRVDWQFAGQRDEARWAETRAIVSERPLYNVILNGRRRQPLEAVAS